MTALTTPPFASSWSFFLRDRRSSDGLDTDFVKYAKGSRLVRSVSVSHANGAEEPRLWIADQILGAMGDYLARTGNYGFWETDWEPLEPLVERLDVLL